MGWPAWWHHHGMKMRVRNRSSVSSTKMVLIEASVAKVLINQYLNFPLWTVSWKTIHESGSTEGSIRLSPIELEAAFDLQDLVFEGGEGLIAEYGGTAVSPGKFIRYKRWLNIPCPGSGGDGDPNVSIELTEEIKEAIQKLI